MEIWFDGNECDPDELNTMMSRHEESYRQEW